MYQLNDKTIIKKDLCLGYSHACTAFENVMLLDVPKW